MSAVTSTRRRLFALAALTLGAWATVVWLTGGLVLDLGGLRVSSRAAGRPALVALLLAAAALWGTTAEERRAGLARARRTSDRLAPWAAALVAIAIGATSAVFNEHVAGGADSSGYISQSRLWARGRVTLEAPTFSDEAWPQRGWLVSPLGYAPAATPGELGPSYSPGLPWLMAAGAAVAGEPGRYIWTPLAVALLTWATFLLARRSAAPTLALAAAVLVATSPPVLFAAMQTMSDLLCAALWTAMLLALARGTTGLAALGGLAAALALVVRPNLVPVAGLVWLAATVSTPGTWPARLRHGVILALPLALAAAIIASLNQRVWGSPFSSGYGATADLFQAANVTGNLARLWQWTGETRGYWMLAAVPALVWACGTRVRATWGVALALVVGLLVSYLPYAVFAEWWYLRFYLAAWPVLAAATVLAAGALLARVSDDGAPIAVLVIAVGLGAVGVRTAADAGTFELWRGAQRYPVVAAWVRDHAPADALVLAVQHSGALADGSGHTIGRWDYIAPDALDATVTALAAHGRAVWLVADDLEEPPFRARFAASTRGALDWAPLAEARVGTARVRLYDLTTPTRAVAPDLIRVVRGGPWPWARRPDGAATK